MFILCTGKLVGWPNEPLQPVKLTTKLMRRRSQRAINRHRWLPPPFPLCFSGGKLLGTFTKWTLPGWTVLRIQPHLLEIQPPKPIQTAPTCLIDWNEYNLNSDCGYPLQQVRNSSDRVEVFFLQSGIGARNSEIILFKVDNVFLQMNKIHIFQCLLQLKL